MEAYLTKTCANANVVKPYLIISYIKAKALSAAALNLEGQKDPTLFPAVMGQKNDTCTLPTTIGRATPSLPVKYHTSLLMTPKNPNSMAITKECWHFHMVDRH